MICRLATKDDEEAIKKIRRYAFESTRNQYGRITSPESELDSVMNTYKLTDYVTEVNGTISSTIGVIDFSQRVRGAWVKMAGISAVACKPEFRRKNHITELFAFIFEKLQKKGYCVSSLYPFLYSFYEKVGYAHVDTLQSYTVRCSNIKQKSTPNRVIHEVYEEDFSRCQPIYQKIAEMVDGLVKRPPSVWKNLLGWRWTGKGFQFICQDLEGNDLGYIILRFEKKSISRKYNVLEVRELVCHDPETKQAFLNFLANHDSQRSYINFAPIDTNYLLYMKNPDIKEKRDITNSMFRIIDVENLLPQLIYPPTLNDEIVFKIEDLKSHCPWNNKTFSLTVADGRGTLKSTSSKADLVINIRALNQIVFGIYTPEELAEVGKISGNKILLERLGQIFPKQNATLRDFF
jgi:predicted acetyltransferase